MPDSATSPRISRRTLLKTGIAGGAALLLARWLYTSTTTPQSTATPHGALDADARVIVAAIAPVMLAGALPAQRPGVAARDLAGVEQAIAGLPPAVRKELDELFALLAFAPTPRSARRHTVAVARGIAGIDRAFLDRWRDSRLGLLRSAYDALHQLVFAAWYGNPRAWAAIGYAGPPTLERRLMSARSRAIDRSGPRTGSRAAGT